MRISRSPGCSLILWINVLQCSVNFWVIWGDIWKEIFFLKVLVKFREIRNSEDLKLEFGRIGKISRWTPKQSPVNLGCSCVGVNCLVVFQKHFSFFYPFFKPLKIFTQTRVETHLNICYILKHRHAKRAGVIFSIDWVAWGKTGC